MALSIRAQALSLLLALCGGLALGLLYDLLRPLRRRSGDTLWDLLFCAAAAGLAFCFAMRAESGVLGTGELAASLFGLLLYFRLPGRFLPPLFEKAAEKNGAFLRDTQNFLKNFAFHAKKLFQNRHG